MKKFSKIFALLFVASLALVGVVGCKKTQAPTTTTAKPTTVNPIPESLRNAVSFIKGLYTVSEEEQVVTGDFERVNKVNDVTVEWTVNVTEDKVKVSAVSGKDLVKVEIKDKENGVAFQLSAKFVKGSDEFTLVYKYRFPAIELLTYAQYAAKAKGDLVKVQGVVVGMVGETTGSTNKCLYIEAVENGAIAGAYYVYGASVDPTKDENLAIGKTVQVLGKKDEYSGTDEITSATYKVLDDAAVTLEPIDLTAAFTAAADLKAATIVGKQHLYVTIKGVTIEPVDGEAASNGYYKFSLGGKTSYVRISGSTCALTAAEQKTFTDTFAEKEFWKADVTGVVQVYSGSFYLYPVNANVISNFVDQDLTDAQKVATAKKKVVDTIQTLYYGNNTVTLPTSSTIAKLAGTTISWALKGTNEHVTVANNVMTITAHADLTTFTLVATVTSGEVHEDYEVVVNMLADSQVKSVSQFLSAKDADNVQYVKGIVGAFKGTTAADSFVIVGADGVSIFSYNKLLVKVGDEIVVSAKYATNNALPQLGTIALIAVVSENNAVPGTATEFTAAQTKEVKQDETSANAWAGKLLKAEGYLVKSGNYINFYEDLGGSVQVAQLYANDGFALADHLGVRATLYGYCRGLGKNGGITLQVSKIEYFAAPVEKAVADVEASTTQSIILKNVTVTDNKIVKSETVNIVFYTDRACTKAANLSGEYKTIQGFAMSATDSTIAFFVEKAEAKLSAVALPIDQSFVQTAKNAKVAPDGWTGTFEGAYDTPFWLSLRQNGETIISPKFTQAQTSVKVTFHYYINNYQNDDAKTSKIKFEALDAEGNVVGEAFLSDNISVKTSGETGVANAHDIVCTLSGTGIVQVRITFVKAGGGNVAFGNIKIEANTAA